MKRALPFEPDAKRSACRRRFSFDLQSSPCKSKRQSCSVTSVPLAKRVVKAPFMINESQPYKLRPIRNRIYEIAHLGMGLCNAARNPL